MALFEAFFTRREDVSDPLILSAIAAGVGLVAEEARTVLDSGVYANAVREEEQLWISRGISGVPAMVFNNEALVTGAQGVENYKRVIQHFSARAA